MTELQELKLAYAECSRQRNELLNKLTSPPAQRTWVGLSDADLAGCDEFEYKSACFWEAKLRSKNT